MDIFRMDWNAFGYDKSRAFVMIHGALKGTALEKAGPFYEAGGVNGTRKPEDFLEFLDRINLDPMRAARANNELLAMRRKITSVGRNFMLHGLISSQKQEVIFGMILIRFPCYKTP